MMDNLPEAFKILSNARKVVKKDWKVFFNSILCYMRNG